MLTVVLLSFLAFLLAFLLLASGLLLGRAGITGSCGAASRSARVDPCGACSPLRRAFCRGRRALTGGR